MKKQSNKSDEKPLPITDQNQTNEEASKPRPKSPIIPALQKKLTLAQSTKPSAKEPEKNDNRKETKPLEKEAKPVEKSEVNKKPNKRHTRIPSVTGLGTDPYIMQQEESKDLGKPPLSHQMTQNKSNKLTDSIEADFRQSRRK